MYLKHTRTAYLRKISVIAALLSLLILAFAFPAHAAEKLFHILTLNDTHGNILPYYEAPAPGLGPEAKNTPVGGLSRALFLIKEEERRIAASSSAPVFRLEAGDVVLGEFIGAKLGGAEYSLLTDSGFDAGVLGNHEFDSGAGALPNMMRSAGFPVLASNLRFDSPDVDKLFQKEAIIERGGVKIGIFGLVAPDLDTLVADSSGVTADPDLRSAAIRHVASLRARGADVIIALTHIGLGMDKKLAAAADGIDIIVGGHSHDAVQEKLLVKNPSGKMTLITQAGLDGRWIGRIDAAVGENGLIPERTSWTLIPVTPETPELKGAARLGRAALAVKSGPAADGAVFYFTKSIDGRFSTVRTMECALGDFAADALKAWGGTDAAFINGGGLRIGRIVPAGPFSDGDIFLLLPFMNYAAKVYMTGAQIREALEKSASSLAAPGETVNSQERPHTGEFLQVSGVRCVIDLSKQPAIVKNKSVTEPGSRVSDIEIMKNGVWEPLEDSRIYTAATLDFVANTTSSLYKEVSGALVPDIIKRYGASFPARQVEPNEAGGRIRIIR